MKMMEYAVMLKRKRLEEIDKLSSTELPSDETKCIDVTEVTKVMGATAEVTKVMDVTTEVTKVADVTTEVTKVADVTEVPEAVNISKVTDITEVSKDAEVTKNTEVSFVESKLHYYQGWERGS